MSTNIPQAAIYGCEGTVLSDEEKRFFEANQPLGFILFARNCDSPEQIKALTDSFKALLGRDDVPVLIDQEGGRVARLGPPHWRKVPAAKIFADIAEQDIEKARKATYINARLMAEDLRPLGINVDCAPAADLLIEGSHSIIGDRAYGATPEMVAALSREVCSGLMNGGVAPVIKHIPGHGRASVDSHESLPIVDASLDVLRETDFIPFQELNDAPWGMTAHITYTAIDAEQPATLSDKVVQLIRNEIGFDGVLLTDDLSMKALKGSFEDRTKRSLDVGCDVVLHCNGKMDEMQAIASAATPMSDVAYARYEKALAAMPTVHALAKEENADALETILVA
jgi:beta-N-acetylhexosaminidase